MTWRNSPSRRQIRNHLAFLAGKTEMEAPKTNNRGGSGPQPEGKVNLAISKAARLFGVIAWRNRRGMLPLPNGGMLPFGVGPHGTPDFLGYTPVKITQAMVGRQVAIFTALESKTDSGVVQPHQQAMIDELKAHGAIAGVCRSGEDVRALVQEWEGK